MKAYAYAIDLKNDPQLISKYKECHREIWPDVLKKGKKSGIMSTRIYCIGARPFMLVEAEDSYDPKSKSFQSESARVNEWEELMKTFQCPLAEAKEGELWILEEIFPFNVMKKTELNECKD